MCLYKALRIKPMKRLKIMERNFFNDLKFFNRLMLLLEKKIII